MKNKINIPSLLVWVVYPISFILFWVFTFVTCSKSDQPKTEVIVLSRDFRMVTIPKSIRKPAEKIEYLVDHYWDNFDFSDTTYTHLPEVTEQAFANYIELLPHTDTATANASLRELLNKAHAQPDGMMYWYFRGLLNKYLYEPASPTHNNELYTTVLEYIITNKETIQVDRMRAKYQQEMLLKNRIGKKAANFTYTLASGKTGTLHDLKSEYVLTLFYNLDCEGCKEIITALKTSNTINNQINNNKLTVLAFYPDSDRSDWESHLAELPAHWVNGYDKEQYLQKQELYDLRAIPSVYLLNRQKNVILKDTHLANVEEYFE